MGGTDIVARDAKSGESRSDVFVQSASVCDRCSLCYDPSLGCTTKYNENTCVQPGQTWCADYAYSSQQIVTPTTSCANCNSCYYEEPGFAVCDSRFTADNCATYGFKWCGTAATTIPPKPAIIENPSAGCNKCPTCWDSKSGKCLPSPLGQCSQLGQIWCGDVSSLCSSCNTCVDTNAGGVCKPFLSSDTCSRDGQIWCEGISQGKAAAVLNYDDWYSSKPWGPRPPSLPRACDWPPTDPYCFIDPFIKYSGNWVHLPYTAVSTTSEPAAPKVLVEDIESIGAQCTEDQRYAGIPRPSWLRVQDPWLPRRCTWSPLSLASTSFSQYSELSAVIGAGLIVTVLVIAVLRTAKSKSQSSVQLNEPFLS